ncbi:DUF72 domain-containing protein [Paenibacillus sp. GCM10012307]|uniref:DUF72 domain-containing protein n=1 Tax=Paenibacillus roseus TaxID=2798579 RepID=A0A934J752_9BACL|nr:DUF72 domain-containing protein [Paenibacillus roseus]MBJ6361612.1 DUF72 domain-containing protein [Paenibacillus roseus]
MIQIGLTGWGDHTSLYPDREAAANKLKTYNEWFETVEVDSMFYAVQPQKNMQKWTDDTSASFRFLVKAYQGMTGHSRGKIPFDSEEAMYEAFHLSLQPMLDAGKLNAVLFQYPPWFDCKRENVNVLREAKRRMGDVPCALEFRHRSWFEPQMRERTLKFMRDEGWIHSICDEPQVGTGCVPIVEEATHAELTVVRFHGRNEKGWQSSGQPNWREVRYLYRYNEAELTEWAQRLERLKEKSGKLCVIFNNNSGGDAADNGKQLMAMLGQMPPRGSFAPVLPGQEKPEQLNLF